MGFYIIHEKRIFYRMKKKIVKELLCNKLLKGINSLFYIHTLISRDAILIDMQVGRNMQCTKNRYDGFNSLKWLSAS